MFWVLLLDKLGKVYRTFGTSFTLYVSAPVSAFIYSMTKGFINFQNQMIEVRRTTGLAMSECYGTSKRNAKNIFN